MSSEPKVSIIIPVYNGSNYLKDAIDSALAQTYKNIEIVVVNDGSNDDGATEKIAKSYGKAIKYYSKPNGGVASALNLGLKKMSGEYFSWLSHDDLYYQDKIEKQINYLAGLKNKKVFLYANYSVLKEGLVTPVVHNHEMLTRKPRYSLLRGCVNGITILVPKTIMDEMGGFDEQLRTTQDYEYWQRIEKKYDFVHMEDVLSITRLHPGQDTVVSPHVKKEGDQLWINMIKKLPESDKIKYEGTLYNFYREMTSFLKLTPYSGALEYSTDKLNELEQKLEKTHFAPKVSVVIPTYNRPQQTLKAIDSIMRQTYKNIEIVLVDDGSTDDMTALKNMVKKHDNIKLFTQKKNAGPATARNRGIRESTGEYIAFLDNDDVFMPDKLEKQLANMAKYNPTISYTAYLKREGDQETLMSDPGLTGIVVPRIISNCTIATPTVVVKKDLLVENNIYFNENMRVAEDTCFWLEIAKHAEILLVNEPLTIVNVGKANHFQDNRKLKIGVKNILTYLLGDEYYSAYDTDISVLFNYFYTINNELQKEERRRLLYEGPVVSVGKNEEERLNSTRSKIKGLIKGSIPYRAYRKMASSAKGGHLGK
jgi:glycosyltransferase involved in cell wall biosynthesis